MTTKTKRLMAELTDIKRSMDAARERGDYRAFAGDSVAFARKHSELTAALLR